MKKMKLSLMITLTFTAAFSFICSYFFNLTADNAEQYLAVVAVIFMDGFFGIISGTKREGFKTFKAIKVLKTLVTWVIMLTVLLMVEKGFSGTAWLSETVITPLIIFQLISSLKNAADAGFIKNELLTQVLKKIDQHKTNKGKN